MPKWVNALDKLPPPETIVFVKNDGILSTMSLTTIKQYVNGGHTELFWLDESDPSFSLEDMRECWNACDTEHADRSGCSLPHGLFEMFISDKYKIDI